MWQCHACLRAKSQPPPAHCSQGMKYTWLCQYYLWDLFLIPLCTSFGCMLLCAAGNWAFQRIFKSRAQPSVFGFTAPATHPHLFPQQPKEPSGAACQQQRRMHCAVPSNLALP